MVHVEAFLFNNPSISFPQFSLAKVCSRGDPLSLGPKACSDMVSQIFASSNLDSHHSAQDTVRRGISETMR